MEINHDIRLSLCFVELFNRPGCYVCKGVKAQRTGQVLELIYPILIDEGYSSRLVYD